MEKMSASELTAQIAYDCSQDEGYMKEFNLRTAENKDVNKSKLIDAMFGIIK
jgi:hypothetical protein